MTESSVRDLAVPDAAPGVLALPGGGSLNLARLAAQMVEQGRAGQLIVHRSTRARAYVYAGEWVADCPREGCGNTEYASRKPRDLRHRPGTLGGLVRRFACSYCGMRADIEWPAVANIVEITAVLDRRPIPHTRNWYPVGHRTAVAAGVPDGQTVEQLLAENQEHGVI